MILLFNNTTRRLLRILPSYTTIVFTDGTYSQGFESGKFFPSSSPSVVNTFNQVKGRTYSFREGRYPTVVLTAKGQPDLTIPTTNTCMVII